MKNMKNQAMLSIVGVLGMMLWQSVAYAQTLEQRVERLERISSNPVLLQHSQRMNDQQREIQTIYDQVDRLVRQVELLETKFNQSYEDMDGRINALETQPKTTRSIGAPTVNANEKQAAAEVPQDRVKAKEVYDKAFGLLRDGKYDDSITALKQFVKDYPDSALVSNAYYWLGEAYLIKQDFPQAYASFETVLKQYASSNKVEDSMLRGADSLVGLNRLDEAKKMYEDLVKLAPKSRAAKSAERRLERFNTGN